ncbi:CocE/NonD family hydrolase [Catenulispora pinisilvae]|uniref:CocE/NonD family hydrolase n=1 Tax=Catenulispora pinisilvae TaxID=2705253 RepID=UPI001890DB82|nr:CocE/NonD family hydrolase [Catenulispora pinisilvae]
MKLPVSTRIARRILRGMPAPRVGVSYEPGLRIPMADGVELLADHYFPDSGTPQDFPTLLVRSPYGRGLRWAALYGVAFAEQGFHVLLQSTRGTAGSGGVFQPWRDDGPDGRSTVAWLRRQPWFDGRLGLVGPSAVAYAHWALAADPPPELKAMVMQMPLHNPHGLFHRSGVFALDDALIATTMVKTQLPGPRRFHGAASHPVPTDGYWQGTDLLDAADHLTVPTLVLSGWADVALDQALQQYGRLPAGHRSLLIGPWTHTSALRKGTGRIFAESLAWLRGHLTGPAPPQERIRVAVGRTTGWRDLTAWPPAAIPLSWYPHPGGALSREPPRKDVAVGVVRYDPDDPTPSVGGNSLAQKSGVQNNKSLEEREDVLVFTGPPLTEATEVIGAVAAEILVRPGAEPLAATLFVRLCDVDERGRSWNVCDGITRVTGPPPRAITVPMSSTAHRFLPGHRLRVQISGGAHPRFAAGRQAFRLDVRSGSVIVLPAV